ncbi:Recombination endonuclease VII [uncultured archaeon]|nr:Recombination endonuclease VII [uncultured archaeon]
MFGASYDPMDARTRLLKAAFNLTPGDWDAIDAYQSRVCFICGRKPPGRRLATDHCHTSGLVRGLLCNRCNAWLGKIENNFKRYGIHKTGVPLLTALSRVLKYLSNPPATQALGREVYGYPGRVGTKAFRKWAKKKAVMIQRTDDGRHSKS